MTDLDHGADLRERMDAATTDLVTPAGLTDAVLSDGRRLRRRRRTLAASGGVVAAGVVAALVAVNLGGGTATTGTDVATQPPAPPAATVTVPGDTPSSWNGEGDPFPEPPPGWWDAPGHLLAAQLQVALPDGVSVARSEEDTGFLQAELDAPDGPGRFEVILYPPDLAAGEERTTGNARGPGHRSRTKCGLQARYADTCEELTDRDGRTIGRVVTFPQHQVTFYEATLLGPDGGLVYLATWNATDEKPGTGTEPSSETPPLTPEQLRDLVQDPAWTSYEP